MTASERGPAVYAVSATVDQIEPNRRRFSVPSVRMGAREQLGDPNVVLPGAPPP